MLNYLGDDYIENGFAIYEIFLSDMALLLKQEKKLGGSQLKVGYIIF
jgi:hypothetical protein